MCFLLWFKVTTTSAQVSFPSRTVYKYPLSQRPETLAAGDLNGDGFSDVVVGTAVGVAVFLNQQNGVLGPATTYPTPAAHLMIADLNGDGKQDLVSIYNGPGFHSWLNQGNGTFQVIHHSGDDGPHNVGASLAVGDFYGDGRNHLAINSYYVFGGGGGTPTLKIYRNQGNATFTNGPRQALTSGASEVFAADINGDSKPDLLVSGARSFSTFLNLGNGTLAGAADYNFDSYYFAAADFDGDGDNDLAVGGAGGVRVMTNQGTGVFSNSVSYSTPTPLGAPISLDVDGDSYPDLFVPSNFGTNNDAILRNKGDGTFAEAITLPNNTIHGSWVHALPVAVDINKDGKIDVVTGNVSTAEPSISIWTNQTPQIPPVNFRLTRIIPERGGNSGQVTATLIGSGFVAGSSVKLKCTGQPDLVGDQVKLGAQGRTLSAVFNLKNAPPSVCNVVVTNPNADFVVLSQGFTIEQGGQPQVWVDVVGQKIIRGARRQIVFIHYGNRGNTDSGQVRFWISFPTFMQWSVSPQIRLAASGRAGETSFLAFDIPSIAAGEAGAIPVNLIAPDNPEFAHRRFAVRAWKEDGNDNLVIQPSVNTLNVGASSFVLPQRSHLLLPDSAISAKSNNDCGTDKTCGQDDTKDKACRSLEANEQITEDILREFLSSKDVTVNNEGRACPTDVSFQRACQFGCRCTSLRGLQASTLTAIARFREELGASFQITGGTECGHDPRLGHSGGYKIDLAPTSSLAEFIKRRFDRLSDFDGHDRYGVIGEVELVNELNHWDILFSQSWHSNLNVMLVGDGKGTVISDMQGINCGSNCLRAFTKGILVNLTANADSESRFTGWEGVSAATASGAVVKMYSDRIVKASFAKRPDPPSDPKDRPSCWTWYSSAAGGRGAWVWDCISEPPQDGGRPPCKESQSSNCNEICWEWQQRVIANKPGWVVLKCGGEDTPYCELPANTLRAETATTQIAPCNSSSLLIEIVTSNDPNDKVGGNGSGTSRWLSGNESLRYTAFFENKPTATADAQDVVIIDQLDLSKIDLATLSLSPITFVDKLVTPLPNFNPLLGSNEFNAQVDLRPSRNLIVKINAAVNPQTGVLTWRFNTIDPNTGQPPPLEGFLKPGEGGSVSFTVMPKQDLPTGMQVRNKASIVFDFNAPLETPEWFNTFDRSKPVSRVLALSAIQALPSFTVKWGGTDDGAGIQDYTVYVSEDGQPFIPWLVNRATTEAVFQGQPGKRYAFYSVARDLVANVESAKMAAEAVTLVCTAISLEPGFLLSSTKGAAYNHTITAAGGVAPYSFSVSGGQLPTGLTLSPAGVLSGMTTTAGSFNFEVTATDANGCTGKQSYTLIVNSVPTASISDPFGCTGPGDAMTVTLTLTNSASSEQAVGATATLPTGLVGLPGTGTANIGTVTINSNAISFNARLAAGQTATVTYQVQVSDSVAVGTSQCINTAASFGGASPATVQACATVNCQTVGPGNLFPASSTLSDQKAGSVLFFNIYTSSVGNPNAQNTRINLTNTDSGRAVFVHLFFVDGSTCSVADSYLCLTPNQTSSFLASDLDPGTTGYLIAVAVDTTGCPINFNHLIGDEYVKFDSGHAANLPAVAASALAGGLPACGLNSVTATLNFDGLSYNQMPRVLALSNIADRASSNDTMLIVNRIGGNLATGAASLGAIFGILYDDSEIGVSLSFNAGTCQFRSSLSNSFPRTAPRFEQLIPAGRSGWMRLWSFDDAALLGAAINFNQNATASLGAFSQGHNLHILTLSTAAVLTIPVFAPRC